MFDKDSTSHLGKEMFQNDELFRQVIRVSEIGIFDHDHLNDTIHWSSEQRQAYGRGADEPTSR
jgi:hypothetical protein